MKIGVILDQIDLGSIALPEFQRGYVWNRDQVRGLMQSLYLGYPVGSLLVWVTPNPVWRTRGAARSSPRLREAPARRAAARHLALRPCPRKGPSLLRGERARFHGPAISPGRRGVLLLPAAQDAGRSAGGRRNRTANKRARALSSRDLSPTPRTPIESERSSTG